MEARKLIQDNDIVKFFNCRLVRNHAIIKEDLWIRNGKILDPQKLFFDGKLSADVQINCKDSIITSGFIDLQINGAFGIDFSTESDQLSAGIQRVGVGLLAHGVTSFAPTIVSTMKATYHKILPQFLVSEGSEKGAGVLGLHLEGPFINQEKCGAHPPHVLLVPEQGISSLLDVYGKLDDVILITVAPELPGVLNLIKPLKEKGIVVSLGHSMADLTTGELAVQAGARFITHLFNAMLPFHHRDPHLVGLLASDQIPKNTTVYFGVIADGIHTHPAALRIAFRTHPDGLVLVTDAVAAMGLPEGVHHIGMQTIEIRNKTAFIAGTNTLCGSIASMDECVRNFLKSTRCTVVEAIECATLHPAQLLGISDRKGTLNYDSDADFLLLTDDLHVQATFVHGKLAWQNASFNF